MNMQLKKQPLQKSRMAMSKKVSELPDAPVFNSNKHRKAKTGQSFSQKKRSSNVKKSVKRNKPGLAGKRNYLIAGGIVLASLFIYALKPATDELSWNYDKHKNHVSKKIELSDMDLDPKVLNHIKQGTVPPEYKHLPPYYLRKIARGEIKIYSITVLDNCAEDGDIVRIKVNRKDLGEVLLTNAGSTISVPLSSSGNDTISIIGVEDGAGGITVTFRTSQGDYYSKVMKPGEVFNMTCGVKN